MKKVLNSLPGQMAVAGLVFAYIWLVRLTCRFDIRTAEPVQAEWRAGRPVIVAIWHGRLLLIPALFPQGVRVQALISAHRDGRIISMVARMFGIRTVTGSTTRGGMSAVRKLLRHAHAGDSLFITPDGPKGPRMTLASGTVALARLSGLPVAPVAISVSRGKLVRSWDRFLVPRPFSRVVIQWGPLMTLPKDAPQTARAAFHQQLETTMRALQTTADATAGRTDSPQPAEARP